MCQVPGDPEREIPLWALDALLTVGEELSFDPQSSAEAVSFFVGLLQDFHGRQGELADWLRGHVASCFSCIHERPRWIQGRDWQFWSNRPMVFVGQIDVSAGANWLHDDAAFYVFWSPETGVTRTIVQVA